MSYLGRLFNSWLWPSSLPILLANGTIITELREREGGRLGAAGRYVNLRDLYSGSGNAEPASIVSHSLQVNRYGNRIYTLVGNSHYSKKRQ